MTSCSCRSQSTRSCLGSSCLEASTSSNRRSMRETSITIKLYLFYFQRTNKINHQNTGFIAAVTNNQKQIERVARLVMIMVGLVSLDFQHYMGGCFGKTQLEGTYGSTEGKTTTRMLLRNMTLNSSFKNVENSEELCRSLLGLINKRTKKTIKNIDLVFRASQHKFKSGAFHETCAGKGNTVLLAFTTSNHIFGGFTPCPWAKDEYITYAEDPQCHSFLFSLQKQELKTYNLKEGSKKSAIMNDQQLGPVFGEGHDIHISNQADKSESWNNLGKSYECLHKFGSVKANSQLCEQEKFKLREYEIWQLEFS